MTADVVDPHEDRPPVLVADHGGVVHIQLNRPAKRNAFTPRLVELLRDAVRDAVAGGCRGIVLSGAGKAFSAGGDLDLARIMLSDPERYNPVWEGLISDVNATVLALREAPCVTVAAVEGAAVGAGLGLALATDLRVMGESARLVPGWVERSASPDAGGSYFLSRFLGPGAMASLAVSGRVIDAPFAKERLIADEVVTDGHAVERAIELADRMRDLSAPSIRSVRRLADRATTHGLAEHLTLERDLMREIRRTAERRGALDDWRTREQDRAMPGGGPGSYPRRTPL